jgi:phosphatidylserine decarboxylase
MVSDAIVQLYARAYHVDLGECAHGASSYPSFDAFFTRPLRPGAREVCSAESEIASPADGHVHSIGVVDPGGALLVKGRPYQVAELIGDEADAPRYAGGQFAVIYLSPSNYHRVHAPVGGRIALVRSMPGDRYPVNSLGEQHVPSLFSRNRRVAIVIDTNALGRVTVVMVGAIIVGRITVGVIDAPDVPIGNHAIQPPAAVAKGDEIGVFHLGSTAIVFVPPGSAAGLSRPLGPIRMGQSLAGAA